MNWLWRVGVGAVIGSSTLLIVAQHVIESDSAWLELSRYLPYVALLLPGLAAWGVSFWFGRIWVAAGAVNVALLLTLGMGLQWNSREEGGERVRVMTWNVKVSNAQRQHDRVKSLALEVQRHDPDIVVLQGAEGLPSERGNSALPHGPLFGLPHVYAVEEYVVASRFALQGCASAPIAPGGDSRQFLRCKVDVRGSALDLVTVHFQSPRDGLNAARREGLDGADDWTGNYVLRLAQSRGLARDLAGSRGPLVVAGDLNAPESSPVIQALLGIGLRDAFSIAGRGYGFTHGHSLRLRHDILRIDHILVSPEVEVLYSFVGQSDATDHRPLIADLRW